MTQRRSHNHAIVAIFVATRTSSYGSFIGAPIAITMHIGIRVISDFDFFGKILEVIPCRAVIADYIGQQYLTIAIFKHIHIASVRCIHTCQTTQ